MIEVQVQLYSILREKLPAEAQGRTILRFEDGATVEDLLRRLDIGRRVVISVNGQHEADGGRPLGDQDEVKIFSSVGGGARPTSGGARWPVPEDESLGCEAKPVENGFVRWC
jgi:molybdopterin converting factor small subunit